MILRITLDTTCNFNGYTKSVLIIKIASAAPFKNFNNNGVFSGCDKVRNIKFRLQVASLCKADICTVYVKKCTSRNAFKNKIDLPSLVLDFFVIL